MWTSGSEDSDDESVVDEELEQRIKTRLEEGLLLPLPCPVCSCTDFAPKRYHLYSDYKALRQHASQRAKDRTREMEKIKHLHEDLIRLVDREIDPMAVDVADVSEEAVAVRAQQIGDNALKSIEDMRERDARLRRKQEEVNELKEGKQKRQRMAHRNVAKLQEVRFQIQHIRDGITERAKLADVEAEKFQEELAVRQQERDCFLRRRRTTIAQLTAKLKDTRGKLSQEEQAELQRKIVRVNRACHDLQVEREEEEKRLKDILVKKAEAQKTWEDARRKGEIFERQAQLLESQCQERIELNEAEEEQLKQLSMLGLKEVADIALRCSACRRAFCGAKDEAKSERASCERVFLLKCGCLDYCRDCAAEPQFRCLRHCDATDAIRLRTTFG